MIKTTFAFLGRFVGTILGLCVILYGVLLVVNWEDRPPSDDIGALKALRSSDAEINDGANSYLVMLGFTAPPGADPMTVGQERLARLRTTDEELSFGLHRLWDDHDYERERSKEVAALAESCALPASDCLERLESDAGTLEDWLRGEQWLLDRYVALTSMTRFHDSSSISLNMPFPPTGALRDGQMLVMANAWQAAAINDAPAVRAALDRDLVYWRRVLENSDALAGKMVATAALERHFKFGNLILRRLPADFAAEAIPMSWRDEMSPAERSMRRSFAGEWAFSELLLQEMLAEDGAPDFGWTASGDRGPLDRIGGYLLEPFWQPQDSSNRYAGLMLEMGKLFDVPYPDIPGAVDDARQLQQDAFRPFSRMYNFPLDLFAAADQWLVSDYALRVSDIEGVRRAALLAAQLRIEGIAADEIADRIAASDIVDPYTKQAFAWRDGAIGFAGLEPDERGKHWLLY